MVVRDKTYRDLKDRYEELKNEMKQKDLKLMTKEELKNLRIQNPKIQRSLNQEHVKELINKIEEEPIFIVPIYIGLLNNVYYVLDGQHRLEAISKIVNLKTKVLVNITNFKTMNDLEKRFIMINKRLGLSNTCISTPKPIAALAANSVTVPAPMITTLVGETPVTPPSTIPCPSLVLLRYSAAISITLLPAISLIALTTGIPPTLSSISS